MIYVRSLTLHALVLMTAVVRFKIIADDGTVINVDSSNA